MMLMIVMMMVMMMMMTVMIMMAIMMMMMMVLLMMMEMMYVYLSLWRGAELWWTCPGQELRSARKTFPAPGAGLCTAQAGQRSGLRGRNLESFLLTSQN